MKVKLTARYAQYIGFYLMAAFVGGNLLGNFVQAEGLGVLACLFSIFIIFNQNMKIEKEILAFETILAVSLLLVSFYTGGQLSLGTVINILVRYLLVYAIIRLDPKNVVSNFLDFTVFFVLAGLFFYLLTFFVGNNFLYSIAPIRLGGGIHSFIVYNIVPIHFGRNLGFFGEPGQYQIFLGVALLLEIARPIENLNRKKWYIAIIILGIISAQSTAGYIFLLGTAVIFIVTSKYSLKVKSLILILLTIWLIYIFFFLDKQSALYYNFIGKIMTSSGLNFSGGSGSARMESLASVIHTIKTQPSTLLGVGYEGVEKLGIDGCASLFGTLVAFGIIPWMIIYGYMIYGIWKYYTTCFQKCVALIIILVSGLSQPNILNPFLIFFTFLRRETSRDCRRGGGQNFGRIM